MLFNRKVLLVALTAVVLMGSSVDMGAAVASRHLRKPWDVQPQMEVVIKQAGIKSEEVNDVILGCADMPGDPASLQLAMDAKEILEVGIPKLL